MIKGYHMSDQKTVKIKIWGIVQGVGFRPFVAKLADRFEMKGEVLNIGGLFDIILTDTPERI
jgi:hydrogenase maturation protein HypF